MALNVTRSICFVLAVFVASMFLIPQKAAASSISVEFIVDFSESMNEMIGNVSKIDIARKVTENILGGLKKPLQTGLTVFGHRGTTQCDDVELVASVKDIDRQLIKQKLSELQPAGKASLCSAVRHVANRLKEGTDYIHVVIITDGKNICDGDIIKTVREVKKDLDYRLIVHIIALNPAKSDRPYLFLAAHSGYGTFFEIKTPPNVNEALFLTKLLDNAEIYTPRSDAPDEMISIPAGEFTMGNDNPIYGPIEHPSHTVYLDSFFIDKYEVTQKSYQDIIGSNPSFWLGSDLPVDSVSWSEAKDYCEKIGKRLPTEAEWEKAAKGGRNDRWAGTNEEGMIQEFCWIHDTGAGGRTHPVGLRKPSGYEVHDMCGNVWEWVSDWFSDTYYQTSPSKNPQGSDKGTLKILRGGNWDNHKLEVRTERRYAKAPDVKYSNNGFRCAKSAEGQPIK
jgi:formylglycine-generating enzyme